jgi:AraC-like DNA-binding protein
VVSRARVLRFEHELGSGARALRAPAPSLRPHLPQGLVGYRHEQVGFAAWLEPPRPEVTLMIDLEGEISADGSPLPSAWVGGLSPRRTIVGVAGRYGAVDLKLSPVAARAVLGMDLAALEGGCVPLGDALGAAGDRLADELCGARDWDARFDVVERWLLRRLADGPPVDPVVARAFELLAAHQGRIRIGALCRSLDVSPRHLTRRFGAQVGLSPKTVARQLRFAAVRRRLETAGTDEWSWPEVALAAGYFDQAHLIRDFRELAGVTPTEFLARRIPEGGLVGDGA